MPRPYIHPQPLYQVTSAMDIFPIDGGYDQSIRHTQMAVAIVPKIDPASPPTPFFIPLRGSGIASDCGSSAASGEGDGDGG